MSYEHRTLDAFLSAVASETVAPAGGTSAAVVGAIGASLCEMTCLHTVGKDGDGDVAAELEEVADELATLRTRLLWLADADAAAVSELLDVDVDADGQQTAALKRSTGVPLAIAETCVAVLESAATVTAKGTASARADAVCGAVFADAALRSAAFVVRTNLEHVEDASFADEMERRLSGIESEATAAFDRIDAALDR